jgi:ribosome maturation factor RimP
LESFERLLFFKQCRRGDFVEYSPLEDMPYYQDCGPLVEGLGCRLVELRYFQRKTGVQVQAVIQGADPLAVIGLEDCARVHRALAQRLEVVTGNRDMSMEVTSPGTERQIKNAAEFALFMGRTVRVWDRTVTDWVPGKIAGAGTEFLALETGLETRNIPFADIAKAKLV